MESQDLATEQRILDAAHVIFVRHGTAGARMQEIADEAGVNKALLHYYFRSKERLAEAVFERNARRLFPPVFGILAGDAPLEEKVEQVIDHYLTMLSAAPYLPAFVLSEMNYHPERFRKLVASATGRAPEGLARAVLSRLGQQIDDEVDSGRIRPISPEQFMVNLLSLCIFPFAACPFLQVAFEWDGAEFEAFIAERRRVLPALFLNSLRP